MNISKRDLLKAGCASIATIPLAGLSLRLSARELQNTSATLSNIIGNAKPISANEREARIKKAQSLMQKGNMAAIVLEPGPAMDYFSGIQWWRSERVTAVVIPAQGEIAVVCPFFEEPSIRESMQVGKDVRVWQEHESPFDRIKQILSDRKITSGQIGFEQSVRYFVLEGVMSAMSAMTHTSADPVTQTCRMVKTQHELQLMHKANEVTLKAYGQVWQQLELGMSQGDVIQLMQEAQSQLGGSGVWNMALFDQSSAYPHGTKQQQIIKEGSIILMDCGCAVHGYQSDISRTFVFGEASKKQREIWDLVRKGQEIAFAAAQIGVEAGTVDDLVRSHYEAQGMGPGYKLPGLSHRTGHGIGMQGHEPVNFVNSEKQKLERGMCFSNEPGIYIPGEFGVRLEDCIYMTERGPAWFSEPPESLDKPLGKMGQLPA